MSQELEIEIEILVPLKVKVRIYPEEDGQKADYDVIEVDRPSAILDFHRKAESETNDSAVIWEAVKQADPHGDFGQHEVLTLKRNSYAKR